MFFLTTWSDTSATSSREISTIAHRSWARQRSTAPLVTTRHSKRCLHAHTTAADHQATCRNKFIGHFRFLVVSRHQLLLFCFWTIGVIFRDAHLAYVLRTYACRARDEDAGVRTCCQQQLVVERVETDTPHPEMHNFLGEKQFPVTHQCEWSFLKNTGAEVCLKSQILT